MLRKLFYFPQLETDLHPAVICINHFLHNKDDPKDKIKKKIDEMNPDQRISMRCIKTANIYANIFKVNIVTHIQRTKRECKYFEKEYNTDTNYRKTIHLVTLNNSWGYLIPSSQGQYFGLYKYLCSTCNKYVSCRKSKDFTSHWNTCARCSCGMSYNLLTSIHPKTCQRAMSFVDRQKNKLSEHTEKKLACKIYKSETKGNDNDEILTKIVENGVHLADFETFIDKDSDLSNFTVYSAGLSVNCSKRIQINYGQNAMKEFMDTILKLQGTLFFFYGSKFDCYFILKYCIFNNIPILNEETIMSSNRIISLTIQTGEIKRNYKKDGSIQTIVTPLKLVIKDLAMFLPGSLADNCRALGIDVSESKSSFDHNLIKSWSDVYKHQEEVTKYLELDVISLRAIYVAAAKSIRIDHGIYLPNFVSLAQMSYAASTIHIGEGMLYKIPTLFKDGTPTGFESKIREAYYGGRLVLTQPLWICENFWELVESRQSNSHLHENKKYNFYNELNDWLIYYDKNSLYPWVMYFEYIPCGHIHHTKTVDIMFPRYLKELMTEVSHQKTLKYSLEGREEGVDNNKQILKLIGKCDIPPEAFKWKYRILCVDLKCPDDIYIPFVFDRDEKGFNVQHLNEKKNLWITGVELLEAMIIGYEVTQIHEFFYWDKKSNLFRDFIEGTNRRKSQAKKDTPAYLLNKLFANSNSGKWAQKALLTKLYCHIGDSITFERLNEFHAFNIYDNNGEPKVCFTESENDILSSPYPIQLSVFILAYSRLHMSVFTRLIDGYRNPNHVPLYGDTDSLVIRKSSLSHLSEKCIAEHFGPHLGQMKDEMPGCKIICQLTLAPKTNMKIFLTEAVPFGPIDSQGNKIPKVMNEYCIFTSKGIPHPRDRYDPFGNYECSPEKSEEIVEIYNFLKERKSSKEHFPNVILREPYFIVVNKEDNNYIVVERITFPVLYYVLLEEVEVLCVFGGMIRNIVKDPSVEEIGISLDYKQRSLSCKNWWKGGNRIITESYPYAITYPQGFHIETD